MVPFNFRFCCYITHCRPPHSASCCRVLLLIFLFRKWLCVSIPVDQQFEYNGVMWSQIIILYYWACHKLLGFIIHRQGLWSEQQNEQRCGGQKRTLLDKNKWTFIFCSYFRQRKTHCVTPGWNSWCQKWVCVAPWSERWINAEGETAPPCGHSGHVQTLGYFQPADKAERNQSTMSPRQTINATFALAWTNITTITKD